jgi:carbonic anhydrase/acetyltransferase-like protein (isoleucine patch superfamily)/dTDP-4-dehydrorhamnose 3,5-epimerase-like enzyme
MNPQTPLSSSAIDPRAVVHAQASIGEDCRIAAGAFIGAGVSLADDVEVGPLAVVGAGPWAASDAVGVLQVGSGVRIGAHATVMNGAHLAARCVVMPGSVVTRPVPPGAIVQGNPASITAYVGAEQSSLAAAGERQAPHSEGVAVRGVKVFHFPLIPDLRGTLTVGEFERQIPFVPKRYFLVFDVPSREVRGEHAHHQTQELLICLRGSCAVMVDDGERRAEIVLDCPHKGVLLPAQVWRVHYKYSPDAMSLVFADTYYDPEDYIRDYGDFLKQVGRVGQP